MSRQANPTLIGIFVTGAIILLVVIIMTFSGGVFKYRPPFIMYFEDSVKGLNVGSPVMLRGVQIGIVKNIQLTHEAVTGAIEIPVTAEFYPETVTRLGNADESVAEVLTRMVIENGLRAQLQSQSFVTGQLFIQLDYYPEQSYTYKGDGSMPEVPTIPTPIESIERKLAEFDIEAVLKDIAVAAASLKDLATAPELREALSNFNKTMRESQKLIAALNRQAEPFAEQSRATLAGIEKAMLRLESAAAQIQGLAREDSPTLYNLNVALEELSSAARSVRALADALERQPEAVLKGKAAENK